ncbi:unnamed protein product [Jaminaea pallidilutea]
MLPSSQIRITRSMSGARSAGAAPAAPSAASTSTPLITPARSSSSHRPLFNREDVRYRGANFRELAARHPMRLPSDRPGSVGQKVEHLRDGDQAVWKKWKQTVAMRRRLQQKSGDHPGNLHLPSGLSQDRPDLQDVLTDPVRALMDAMRQKYSLDLGAEDESLQWSQSDPSLAPASRAGSGASARPSRTSSASNAASARSRSAASAGRSDSSATRNAAPSRSGSGTSSRLRNLLSSASHTGGPVDTATSSATRIVPSSHSRASTTVVPSIASTTSNVALGTTLSSVGRLSSVASPERRLRLTSDAPPPRPLHSAPTQAVAASTALRLTSSAVSSRNERIAPAAVPSGTSRPGSVATDSRRMSMDMTASEEGARRPVLRMSTSAAVSTSSGAQEGNRGAGGSNEDEPVLRKSTRPRKKPRRILDDE